LRRKNVVDDIGDRAPLSFRLLLDRVTDPLRDTDRHLMVSEFLGQGWVPLSCTTQQLSSAIETQACYRRRMHGCLDCGKPLAKKKRDHLYGYDHGKKILLREMTILVCACGYSEIEIPRMGPLHETIKQALSTLRVKRDALAFFFTPGDHGVRDGAWGVVVRSPSAL
jgi:hypothetical protein